MTGSPDAGLPPLHLVTDDSVLAADDFLERAASALTAGGPDVLLQLRGHRSGGRRLFELAAALIPLARERGAAVMVNDRIDVALASGAAGAQLGAHGVPLADARRLLGPDRLLGASVHSADEAATAAAAGADFLVVGTLYASVSHPGREGAGPGLLRELVAAGLPMIGIGGITPASVRELVNAGAAGVAVLRGVWSAADAAAAVGRYLDAWRAGR